MTALSPVSGRERLAAVDVIRGWALLGVRSANIHVDLGGLRYHQLPGDGALLQVIACRLWLARFRFGPVEWLWRTLVYGCVQPMLRAATAA